MTKKLSGKVALVTGGSRGIGAASARALAAEGANVAISYVASPDKAEAVVAELKAKGVNARAYKADQASSVDVDQLVKNVAKDFGRLDILVNNAGEQHSDKDIGDITEEQLTRTFQTNIFGMFYLTQAATPHLTEGSTIINCTSAAVAPSAIRIPISRVRCRTEYEITP